MVTRRSVPALLVMTEDPHVLILDFILLGPVDQATSWFTRRTSIDYLGSKDGTGREGRIVRARADPRTQEERL